MVTLEHKLRKLARTFDMVPTIVLDSLASTSKFGNTRQVTVFDKDELNIYNIDKTTITALKPPILKGWRDRVSPLWRIPFVKRAPRPNVGQVTTRLPVTCVTNLTPIKIDLHWQHHTQETIQNVYFPWDCR